jgi:hypothetical protein
MDVFSLISRYGHESGLALALGPAGTLDLTFDCGVTVILEHDAELNVLHGYVVLGMDGGESEQRAALYHKMLCANAFGHGTEGATLGLDESNGEFLLTARLDLTEATTDALRKMVDGMVATAPTWQEAVRSLGFGNYAGNVTARIPAATSAAFSNTPAAASDAPAAASNNAATAAPSRWDPLMPPAMRA